MTNKSEDVDPFTDDQGEAGGGFIIGIGGTTGSGKTFTALRLARGAAAEALGLDHNDPANLAAIDAAIAFIDTESRRAMHYKARGGAVPTLYQPGRGALFGFRHAELDAPFAPEAYETLIDKADRNGYAVVVIDSWSHSWDGEGGLQDIQSDDLEKAYEKAEARARSNNNGNLPSWWRDDEQRDKLNIGAWKGPKRRNKRLVNRMLRSKAHLIICMRAEDKLRIETEKVEKEKRNGGTYTVSKTTITAPKDMPIGERWAPICEKRLPYEFTVGFTVSADDPGRPYPMKTMQAQLRDFFDWEKPLDEAAGAKLGAWARNGGTRRVATGPLSLTQSPAADTDHPLPSQRPTSGGEAPASPPPSPPLPPSDTFPGDLIELWGQSYDHARPRQIQAPIGVARMDADDVTKLAKALAELIKRAAPQNKRAWLAAQGDELAALRARGPRWVTALEELAGPQSDNAPPPSPPLQQTGTGDDF